MRNDRIFKHLTMVLSLPLWLTLLFQVQSSALISQCVPVSGKIQGTVYHDLNSNGKFDAGEPGLSGIHLTASGPAGEWLGDAVSDFNGNYQLSDLKDGSKVRLVFSYSNSFQISTIGTDNKSDVQSVAVPACNASLGVMSSFSNCNSTNEIITTCFVQGKVDQRPNEPTIVGIPYGFESQTPARKFAMHGETGSIWGLAWKSSTQEIFSTAFVKQHAGLKYGHDAIMKTAFNGSMYATSLFVKLSDLGIYSGNLSISDPNHCSYGQQVGKTGLGAMVISPNENYLYITNINNNTIVKVPTSDPKASNTEVFNVPVTEGHIFALKYYNDKIYVGTTVPGKYALVHIFDPVTKSFSDSGLRIPILGDWSDNPIVGGEPNQWLTDLDFTDNGDMLISFSDRIGHIYCNDLTSRLDEQKGDLMIAWKKGNGWELEDRSVDSEFFSDDFWLTQPAYHPEITIGSIYAMPGTGSVVATVFDPETNSYSGGLHRYSTINGKKIGSKELYTRETVNLFGKATGFGEIIATCGLPVVQFGNLVWYDKNEDGLQNADEEGLAGVHLNLYNSECELIASTLSNQLGYYSFHSQEIQEPVIPGNTYYIGIDATQRDEESGFYQFEEILYKLTKSVAGFPAINSDAKSSLSSCNHGLAAVNTTTSSHTYDLGFVKADNCDVKIVMEIKNEKPVKVTDWVEFEIAIQNNSESALQAVEISNLLPRGYNFDPSRNPGWRLESDKLVLTLNQKIKPGDSAIVPLLLGFNVASSYYEFTNEASISAVYGTDGSLVNDLSICFTDATNSVANATPEVCDLALAHRTVKGDVFSPGSTFTLVSSVCNQGNLTAENYTLTVYLREGMKFDPTLNPGWKLTNDPSKIYYEATKPINPGICIDHLLKIQVASTFSSTSIVSLAEISQSSCGEITYDFDSNPDDNPLNDKGGVPGSNTDNMISNSGDVDEDDHDPAIIAVDIFDLALQKSAISRRAYNGRTTQFNLKVTNEGSAPVSSFELTEYIPEGMYVADNNWKVNGKLATRRIEVANGLQPGASITTQCTFSVLSESQGPVVINNVAEITHIFDMQGRDVSAYDIDSKPGNFEGYELGSLPGELKEDDVSSAYVVLITPLTYTPCVTCRPATNTTNGQFETTLSLGSMSGETWYIESSNGLYNYLSPAPPANPIPLTDGIQMTEVPAGISSYYEIKVLHLDGKGFSVRVRNNFGDLEQLVVLPGTCEFAQLSIQGPRSLCNETDATFKATGQTQGPLFWSVNGMPIYGVYGTEFTVEGDDWDDFGDSPYYISVASSNSCVAPGEQILRTGVADFNAVACKGSLQVSLDGDCSIEVTPAMLAAGPIYDASPYVVMLMDKDGNIIPDAILQDAHAGTKVTGKLIEGCGGNSCWTTIYVEDKTPPASLCKDIVLPCYKLDEYVGPFETDNCGGPVNNVLVSEATTALSCNEDFVMFIDRVYRATDRFGNISAPCNMRISLERPDFHLLAFPGSFLMAEDNALSCNSVQTDQFGRPSPEMTGVPTLAGIPLYPSFSEICNLVAWYVDEDLGYIGCTRKIKRTWYVYEQWCSDGVILTEDQNIEIIDDTNPEIAALPSVSLSAHPDLDCMAAYVLPVPQVSDDCNPKLKIDVTWSGGFISDMKTPTLIQLPEGTHSIVYTVYDGCYNSSQTTLIVTVEDKTVPFAICKGEISVSLNSQGEAYITPVQINNGSFDGCTPVNLLVAEATPGSILTKESFGESVSFDCSDANSAIMIALMVTDQNENANTCMMRVQIQDKILPVITCPSNITIDCSEVFSGMDLSIYGNATAFDVCGAEVRELAPLFELNNCRVGVITRYFTATDNQTTTTCEQKINVESSDIFDPYTDVVKPVDYTAVNICSFDDLKPENLPEASGPPVIHQSACGLAGSSYADEVFTIANDACYKILRRWTVIDWCEMNRLGADYVPYEFTQVIKVINNIAPEFTGTFIEKDTFLTYPQSCDLAPVRIQVTAEDDCTIPAHLNWHYKVDLNQDGDYDLQNSGFGPIATLQTDLPLGTHTVQWTFEDKCGNFVTRDQEIVVRNEKKPVAVSVETISVSVVPWDTDGDGIADVEKACIRARTLDVSSISFCCTEPLRFSFSTDVNDTLACFSCINIGRQNVIELWVHDCFGNYDIARVMVDVQDNNDSDICENFCLVNAPQPAISGNLSVCSGSSTTLTASGGIEYEWSTGAKTPTINVSPTTNTIYRVTVTNAVGCTASTLVTVNVRSLPVPEISGGNICPNTSTTLTVTGGVSYAWSNGSANSSITVSPAVSTTYTVTVTNSVGCSASTSRLVTVLPRPVVNISGTNTICIGTSTTLTANAPTGSTYRWGHGPTTSSVDVGPTTTTTYTVTITDTNGCTNSDSRTVNVNSLPVASITGDLTICSGENTSLTATGGTSYAWSTGGTGATINVTPLSNTTYTVTVTAGNGCTSTASATVTVDSGELVCTTRPATIYLNATGSVTLLPSQISTGISGTCASVSLSVSPSVFNCNDIFVAQTVVLTVTNNNNGNSLSCTAVVTVRDTLDPNITCPTNRTIACNVFNPQLPLSTYGNATATDNCPSNLGVTSLPIINLNQCNVGQIIRTFTATDNSNNTRRCVQTINVVNSNPITLQNISFPADVVLTNCDNFNPSATGTTTVNTSLAACSDVSITFTDNKVLTPPICVDTLLRTWRVVDSCQLVPGTNNGIFTHVQSIIIGTQIPIITGPANITLYADPSTCMGFLESGTHSAIGCNLVLNNDRTNDGTFIIKGDYPFGNTTVRLTASQNCNNSVTIQDVVITVLDTSDVSFLCVKTFPEIKDVSPQPLAMDFVSDHYSILGNCQEALNIKVSFSRTNVNDTMRNYTCSQVGAEIPIKIYFWLGNAVIDSCSELVTPVDPNGLCPSPGVLIAGKVQTENLRSVPGVSVYLEGTNMPYQMTSADGIYEFPRMGGGGSYKVVPLKNSDPLEGVSTLDLIYLQRHILKIAPLNSPYKVIAADINDDKKVTAADILQLRKLLLGVYNDFPNNRSWRMIDKSYHFGDSENPLYEPIPEVYSIEKFSKDMYIDWVGIKTGDLNGSYTGNVKDGTIEQRNNNPLFTIENRDVATGEVLIPVVASQYFELSGFQTSMHLHGADLVSLSGGVLNMNASNYNVNSGILNISWNEAGAYRINAGDILFYIHLNVNKSNTLSGIIKTVATPLNSEYYTADLNTHALNWRIEENKPLSFAIESVYPNPWKNQTSISVNLPANDEITVRLRDINGKVVLLQRYICYKGSNVIHLTDSSIPVSGLLFCDVMSGNEVRTIKMIHLD